MTKERDRRRGEGGGDTTLSLELLPSVGRLSLQLFHCSKQSMSHSLFSLLLSH